MNLVKILYEKRNMDKLALRHGEREISYRELWNCIVSLYEKIKTVKEDKIGIWIDNSIEYVVAYFAVLLCRKAAVLIPTMSSDIEVVEISKDLDIHSILVGGKKDLAILAGYNQVEVILDSNYKDDFEDIGLWLESCYPEEVALIMRTSGTTGKCKYVPLTHGNLLSAINSVSLFAGVKESNNTLILLPMTTAFCNGVQFLIALNAGLSITIYDGKINPKRVFSIIEEQKISNTVLTFSLLKSLYDYLTIHKHDISSLKFIACGGEMHDADTLKKIREAFGQTRIVWGYGLTETCAAVSVQGYDKYDISNCSAGKPYHGVKVKIVDDEGREVPAGTIGEIMVAGPNVIDRYYGCDESILKDGYFATGDLGYLDANEELNITGRKKNIIISAGRNISIEEVEAVLMKYDKIKEVRVFSEKDQLVGEEVVAEVVVHDKGDFNDVDVISFCKKWLPDYKIPKRYYVVNHIKRNILGKVMR